jgi:hypothetical protein
VKNRSAKTWQVALDDERAWEIEGVASTYITPTGALILSDAAGAWLAAFAPGGWRDVQPLEDA